jgi:predicted aspartyl protease
LLFLAAEKLDLMRLRLLVLLLLIPLFSFDVPPVKDASVDIEVIGDFQTVTIPLKRVGRLFLIEARIGDQSGNFVFDTGASKLVLNRTYFRKDLMPVEESASGITGNIEKVFQMRVPQLAFSGLSYENVVADVINLGHIENRRGVKILGLFGMNLFRSLEMVVDLRRGELHLYRIDKKGNRTLRPSENIKSDILSPIKEFGGVVFLQANIGGKSLDFCLDTGAEANVLSSTAVKRVLSTVTITQRSDLTGSGSSRVDVLYGTMNDFTVGSVPLHPMQTMITGMDALALAYNYPLSGVLGYDFFEKGLVCINLVKKELSICLETEVAQ